MKIHKLSNVIAAPFALVLFYILYQTFFNDDSSLLLFGLLPTMILILLYLFQPQINYWWLSKHPVELDGKVLSLLNKTNSFYRALNLNDKKQFEKCNWSKQKVAGTVLSFWVAFLDCLVPPWWIHPLR